MERRLGGSPVLAGCFQRGDGGMGVRQFLHRLTEPREEKGIASPAGKGEPSPEGQPQPSIEEKRRQQARARQSKATRRLVQASMLGVIVILIYGLQFHGGQYASVISIGLLAAGACLVVGGLLGFLFGIPHTLQGSGSQAP